MATKSGVVDSLLTQLQSSEANLRTEAWRAAGEAGAEAVPGLAHLMGHADQEVARAAKRALWQLTRHAGRPGATELRAALQAALLTLLAEDSTEALQREVLWMLSEVADEGAYRESPDYSSIPFCVKTRGWPLKEFRERPRLALCRWLLERLRRIFVPILRPRSENVGGTHGEFRTINSNLPGPPRWKPWPKKQTRMGKGLHDETPATIARNRSHACHLLATRISRCCRRFIRLPLHHPVRSTRGSGTAGRQ